MGRGGIYYRKSLASPRREPIGRREDAPTDDSGDYTLMQTADVEQLIESSSDEVLDGLNAPGGNWLRRLLGLRHPWPMDFELDPYALETFTNLQRAIQALAQSRIIWLVDEAKRISTSTEQKYNAGADQLLKRRPVRAGLLAPPKIKTNVEIYGIDIGIQQLLFFPDRLLIHERGKYAAIPYADLIVHSDATSFIESGAIPSDGEVTGSTWQYVNKTGGPDRRFSNNRQIPIMLYGAVRFKSAAGLNITLETSNKASAEQCGARMTSAIERMKSAPVPRELSQEARAISRDKPLGWEYVLLAQVLRDGITEALPLRRELNLPVVDRTGVRVPAIDVITTWLGERMRAAATLISPFDQLMNKELQEALGAPGVPGDEERIVYVAGRVAMMYREVVEWALDCRRTRTDPIAEGVTEMTAGLVSETLLAFERFSSGLTELSQKIEHPDGAGAIEAEFSVTLIAPSMLPLKAEMRKVLLALGRPLSEVEELVAELQWN